jgi:hypothetical protein
LTEFATPISLKRAGLLRWTAAPLLCAVLMIGAAEVQAQAAVAPPPPGQEVQAVDYAPIPSGATFEVQTNEDSELSQDAVGRIQSELPNHGYGAQDGAALVMVVETDLVRGDKQDDPLGQMHATGDEAEVQARLFSTTQNSLLNPQRPIGSADRLFRISLAVYDRSNGLYVWRGSAMRNNPDIDVDQATSEMIAALIGAVGKSVNTGAQAAE